MDQARTRFSRRALLVGVATLLIATVVGAIVVLPLHSPVSDTGFGPLIAVIAVVLLLLGLGGSGIWNWIGLARIRRLRPDALVFLARREPSLAPDLPMYLHRHDITADVSDRWVAAVIDERGMAAWSSGVQPREIFVMPWSELGEVTALEFMSLEGQPRFGIAVDVAPFPLPLLVRVGDAAFGLQGAFDRAGTIAVSDAANVMRPVHARA